MRWPLLLLGAALLMTPSQSTSPDAALNSLLEADRAFASAAGSTTVIPALTTMFAPDVYMQGPDGMKRGTEAATASLRTNPANNTARITWAPLRGGISADGQHGFTFGYMSMTAESGVVQPLKYLAYWVRHEGQWRVSAYRRRLRAAGDVSTAMLAPALPERIIPITADPATLAAQQKGLIAAEQAFSDRAQKVGLGVAFTEFGWPDAMNMGGATDAAFVIGNEAVGRAVGGPIPTSTSPVYWSADDARVASSGDLGVTIGFIRTHVAAGAPAPAPIPFFTIWRRINGVWKYIAE